MAYIHPVDLPLNTRDRILGVLNGLGFLTLFYFHAQAAECLMPLPGLSHAFIPAGLGLCLNSFIMLIFGRYEPLRSGFGFINLFSTILPSIFMIHAAAPFGGLALNLGFGVLMLGTWNVVNSVIFFSNYDSSFFDSYYGGFISLTRDAYYPQFAFTDNELVFRRSNTSIKPFSDKPQLSDGERFLSPHRSEGIATQVKEYSPALFKPHTSSIIKPGLIQERRSVASISITPMKLTPN
jgi:hypothetical protein